MEAHADKLCNDRATRLEEPSEYEARERAGKVIFTKGSTAEPISFNFQASLDHNETNKEPITPWGFITVANDNGPKSKPNEVMFGHPKFYEIVDELMQLHSEKNHDYAAGGDPLGNFHRVAKILEMYPGLKPSDPTVVALIYALKQLDAALWILSNGHEAKVEGIKDRLRDVAVYSILQMILSEENDES